MPKLKKFKKYDYSKSYQQIKEKEPSAVSQSADDDCSARNRGRRIWGRPHQKSDDSKSVISQQPSYTDELYQAPLSNQEIEPLSNQEIGPLSNQEIGPLSNQQIEPLSNQEIGPEKQDDSLHLQPFQQANNDRYFHEDTQPLISQHIRSPAYQKYYQKQEKNEKKQNLHEDTVTIHSHPYPQSKLEEIQPPPLPPFLAMEDLQIPDGIDDSFLEQDNEDFILEFNPPPSKQEEPREVFRSSFIFNNQYICVEVYLDRHRKAIEDRIKAMLDRKNPSSTQSQQGAPLKTEGQIGGIIGEESAPLRKRKKKRTAVTARVLEDVQLMFRHYEEQQKFYGTPCYRKKLTLRSIGETLSLSPTEIKHLYDQFTVDPLFSLRFNRLQPQGCSGVASQQLQQIRLKFIQQLVSKNCVMTQQEIADEMNRCQDLLGRDRNGHLLPITRKIVQILLKKGNYSRKKVQMVPKNRNSPQTIQLRHRYCKQYLQLLAMPNAQIFFLDESRFNMMTMRDRGWAKKGSPATKTTVNSKGKDIMLLAIISPTGLVWYELSDGYNAAAFTISIDRALKQLTQQRGLNPHRFIILDNCPIHNRENLKNIQTEHGVKMVFLPPYTPMLNPIEYWFNEVKSNFRQKTYKTRLEMKNSLDVILNRYREKSFENYYGCIKPYLELGIRRELTK